MSVPEIITFDQAKTHLRVDHDHEDAYIEEKRVQAIATVLNYIKQYPRDEYDTLPVYDVNNPPTFTPWPWPVPVASAPYWWPAAKAVYRELPPYVVPDWFGSPTAIPQDIQAATLLVVGALFRDREGKESPITPGVVALLERWRDPTMA